MVINLAYTSNLDLSWFLDFIYGFQQGNTSLSFKDAFHRIMYIFFRIIAFIRIYNVVSFYQNLIIHPSISLNV